MSTQNYKPVPQFEESWLLGSWSDFKQDRLALVNRVARQCGPLGRFRLGPVSMYLVNSAPILKQLLVDQAANTTTRPFMQHFYPVLGRTTLPGIDGAYHRRLRRIMAPVFQHKRLVHYTEHMVSLADQVQRGLEDGQEVELVHLMHDMALRIMAKTIFAMDYEEDARFFESIKTASRYISDRVANPLRLPIAVPTERNRRDQAAIDHLRNRAYELLTAGRNRGTDKGDVLSMLLMAKDEDGTGLTEEELQDQILTLYVAGHETTANTLAFTFMAMARHPEVQTKLQAELDEVLGGRPPTYEDTPRLRYTLQVVKESLRMYPPALFFGRAPLTDMEADGYLIPKGQFCLISPYVLHRNPEFYPDPERFDPDRFTPENEKKFGRNTYMPFGDGPHVCIGQHFAVLEAQLALAHIYQNLSFEVLPNQQPRLLPLATLTSSPVNVKVTRRRAVTALAS
jgi:cytochrome P450